MYLLNLDDGSLSRREHSKFHTERYGVNSTVASAMFDLSDINGDDVLSEKDWEFHFSGKVFFKTLGA